ncbi:hypothetical protein M378DRAFT_172734 [Amanita muscaria Koide BX008]|uniref:Uncharacterized protein n=1 Tax=Amanita muscaria (strain Koide BX008) TaxID=946122 RepID=A0A0C2SR18_AMAMK|nr:hypothetical protein M378DRAFT_172734 [Amanita muscaria Koide BX008]
MVCFTMETVVCGARSRGSGVKYHLLKRASRNLHSPPFIVGFMNMLVFSCYAT